MRFNSTKGVILTGRAGKYKVKMEGNSSIYHVLGILLILLLSSLLSVGVPSWDRQVSVGDVETTGDWSLSAGNRAENIDIMINWYGVNTVPNNPDYYSIDIDYIPFCDVRNRNATDVSGVLVNCTIFEGGNVTPLREYSQIVSVNKFTNQMVEFDAWHPMKEAEYRLFFEIGFDGDSYRDPNPGNNNATKTISVEERVDVSVEKLELYPDLDRYTQGQSVQANITVMNNALSRGNFSCIGNISSVGSNIPVKSVSQEFSLAPSANAVMRFNYTIDKVSLLNVSAWVINPENRNDDDNMFRHIDVIRIEPPVAVITKPVSNLLPSEEAPEYYFDEAIELDASKSWNDPNSTDLVYTWESSLEGILSHKAVDTVTPLDAYNKPLNWQPGTHVITLTVSDGTYTRNTETVIEIKTRGDLHDKEEKTEITGQYVGGDNVDLEVTEIEDPGVAYPSKLLSMGLFQKISIDADKMPESLLWLNISVEIRDYMQTVNNEETKVDDEAAWLYIFDEEEVKWTRVDHRGVYPKDKKTWIRLENPDFTTKIGLFCKMKLDVAKISGTVYGWSPETDLRTPLPAASLRIDRADEVFSDETGAYSFFASYSKEFEITVAMGGYTEITERFYLKKGEEIKRDFVLKLKLGEVNGTVVDYRGDRIAGVEVVLLPKAGRVFVVNEERYIAFTNDTGNFHFEHLPIGSYRLTLTPMGKYTGGSLDSVTVDFEKRSYVENITFNEWNEPPEVELIRVEPAYSGTTEDVFKIYIKYRDPEGLPPSVLNLRDEYKGTDKLFTMEEMEGNITEGVEYTSNWYPTQAGTFSLIITARDSGGKPPAEEPPPIVMEIKDVPEPDTDPTIPTWLVIVIVAVLVLGLAIGAFLFTRSSKKKYFCPECGEEVGLDDFECPECGEELPDFTMEEEEEEYEDEDDEEEVDDEDFDSYTSIRST